MDKKTKTDTYADIGIGGGDLDDACAYCYSFTDSCCVALRAKQRGERVPDHVDGNSSGRLMRGIEAVVDSYQQLSTW